MDKELNPTDQKVFHPDGDGNCTCGFGRSHKGLCGRCGGLIKKKKVKKSMFSLLELVDLLAQANTDLINETEAARAASAVVDNTEERISVLKTEIAKVMSIENRQVFVIRRGDDNIVISRDNIDSIRVTIAETIGTMPPPTS
jgi:hypothetical protein